MHVVSSATHLAGGLGLALVGTWLATSGLGIALGRRLGAGFGSGAQSGPRSFLRGVVSATLLGANGALPTGAASLARRAGMTVERTTLLLLGSSFGAATMALLVLLSSRGWGASALALSGLGVAAATHSWRSRWTPWGEATAGIALVLLGLDVLARGWSGVAPWLHLSTVDQRPVLVAVWAALGLAAGIGLRSPGAAAALFVSGSAAQALDVLSAAAALPGVLLSIAFSTAGNLRAGTAEERSLAAVHSIFALLAALLGGLVFAWGYNAPSILTKVGPAEALAFLLFTALGGATALIAVLQRPLHWILVGRLAPRLSGSRLARELNAGCASIPALALGGLGGAVDAASGAARDLAHKELSGSGTTEQRRRQAREAALAAIEEIQSFRAGLEGVRWPGEAVESVLHAARSARMWRQSIELLEELADTPMPRGDEALKLRFVRLRFGALYRIQGIDEEGHEVSAEHLAEERHVFEVELTALRADVVAASVAGTVDPERLPGIVRHIDILSELVRTALEAVESRERIELASFRFLPELPEDVELVELEEEEHFEEHEEAEDRLAPELVEDEAPEPGPRYVRIGEGRRRSVPMAGTRTDA